MARLFNVIQTRVAVWREAKYLCDFPAIAEILEYAWIDIDEERTPRFLRSPRIRALETYRYLRLIQKTPSVPELYERLLEDPKEYLRAREVDPQTVLKVLLKKGIPGVLEQIKTDDVFVKQHKFSKSRIQADSMYAVPTDPL